MIEKDRIYKLLTPLKGWPVHEAHSLEEASHQILGSPYWQIPEDTYTVIDKNETYSLIAVYRDGRVSGDKRYLVINMKLLDKVKIVTEGPSDHFTTH